MQRYGWELLSYVLLTNHLHAFCRTPEPDLSRGMQYWLSGYANWWCRRHRFAGHVFQGRFKGALVEDDTYFWAVSRYIHLNPVRAELVDHPSDWPWSSYAGYAHRRRRAAWMACDTVLDAWQGEFGGSDAAVAYGRFVEQGIQQPPDSPFAQASQGWILGSQAFTDRLRSLLAAGQARRDEPQDHKLLCIDVALVWQVTAEHYRLDQEALGQRGRHTEMPSVAAWLAKRHTPATLRELAEPLGLGRPQSVGNLTRRVDLALSKSATLRRTTEAIEARIAGHLSKMTRKSKPARMKNKK